MCELCSDDPAEKETARYQSAMKIIAIRPQLFDAEEAEDSLPCECTD